MPNDKGLAIVIGIADYPHGLATPFRMRMIARSLGESGYAPFILIPYAPGVSGDRLNRESDGTFEGVRFSYGLSPIFIPHNMMSVIAAKFSGFIGISVKLVRLRFSNAISVIVSYGGTAVGDFSLWLLSRVLGSKLILEFCDEASVTVDNLSRLSVKGIKQSVKLGLQLGRENLAAGLADGIFVISKGLRAKLAHIGDKRVFILPILGDLNEWLSIRQPQMSEKPSVAWVGNFRPFEGLETLVDAIAHLEDTGCSLQCHLYGRTAKHMEYAIKIEKYIKLRGLKKRILIHDAMPRQDLLPKLCTAWALVLPRPNWPVNRTNLPTKLIEFLGSGRPVVMTPVGEVMHYFKDGDTAVIAQSDSAIDLSRALEWTINDPKSAERIGLAGKALAKSVFDFRGVAPSIDEFLKSLE
ncbi:MAG: glycosyltransferase [Acidobacteria bacterium]|nr:glycosyltransferase [Acidobacteriota bacterium]